jgi:hypothetical protein
MHCTSFSINSETVICDNRLLSCSGVNIFPWSANSLKSGDIEEELAQAKKAVAILGGEIENVTGFELPGGEGSRSLIKIKKMKPISAKYPRKAGLPGKEPLGTK